MVMLTIVSYVVGFSFLISKNILYKVDVSMKGQPLSKVKSEVKQEQQVASFSKSVLVVC